MMIQKFRMEMNHEELAGDNIGPVGVRLRYGPDPFTQE
jgi:hypothetical protein